MSTRSGSSRRLCVGRTSFSRSSGASASAIIVVRGAAQFGAYTLRALGVAVYAHESPVSIRAQENDTLLVSLLAFPEVLRDQAV